MAVRRRMVMTIAFFFIAAFLIAPVSFVHALTLSSAEQEYIRNKQTVSFISQTRYAPFEFANKDGQCEGMMLDVIRWLAVEIGFQPVFADATFQQAQEAVLSGRADVLTSLFYSDRRDEKFAFTETLYDVPASMFVQADRTDIKDIKDLNGKIVAVQKGDYAKEFLEFKQIRFEILDTNDFAEAADMVIAGKADAVIGDEQIVLYHIFSSRLTDRIKKVGEPLYTGRNCMASNKQNALLIGILNKGIQEARKTGVLDKISKKWLGTKFRPEKSWIDHYLWHIVIGISAVLLLSLWVWGWNARLRTIVRRKTEDIRRSEEALRESEAKYRDLFENASDIIYTHDMNGRCISVNEAARKILGFSSTEFQSLHLRDIVDPESLPIVAEELRKKSEEGVERSGPYEILVRSKDGTSHWFEINSRVIIGDGKPVGVHGTARDITERKRAKEALRESEEKYRLVVENANEAILVAQGEMLRFVNRKAVEIMGYSEEELTSRPFVEFIHPDDRALVAGRYSQRLAGLNPPQVYAFRIVDRLGNLKWMEINAVALTWEGKPASLNFLVDITGRRKMEEELVKIQKLESLGVLAGGIAHDFNNILTAILGNISLAKMQAHFPEKATIRLTEAEKACLQAQGLTKQLLTFSKGGIPIKKTTIISQLIADSCNFAVTGSSSRCDFLIPDDLLPVDVDEGQIGQVLNNLVINAVHAMPQGGMIQVQAENVRAISTQALPLEEGDYVKISVRDQGIGIPERVLPKIFDPYFTTKNKGSGLGLATAYSIIKNHGGLITAESKEGVGTTMYTYLPAAQAVPRRLFDVNGLPQLGDGKILIMDDELSIRDVVCEVLSTLGYTVVLARDGSEAIKLYNAARESSHPFDVVVLDLTVADGMGGAETMQMLLHIDPNVKAVVSSGYSNDPLMADYATFGFKAMVAKPYTAKQLSDTLKRVMAHS
ncbi:PAS domain S-box protein [Desulfomonile tiedjei]|uniref:histidine kinase n=1 Tax=Desulfomonile tiedjei (strain ATCC 49306 / DSM 6799 / DCB-1) TaxID=706587 RepID=I4C586_DESTA|nr:PAS domain S-box protein [Desulfomonile tiedjei]AFM24727.1 PAS domain S-box [Desulfomonile tiedjei DSM 6799]